MVNRVVFLLVTLSAAGNALPADFCVPDAATLVLTLDIADDNGQSDVVRLVQGSYSGNFDYNANVAEGGDLRIEGGYTPGCADRVIDPDNTVLSGAGGRTLNLSGRDNSSLVVEGITVTGGAAQLGGAGLDIGRWTGVQVLDNVFRQNQTAAGFDGAGGLNIDRSAMVEVAGNRFLDNFGGKGGGLSLSDPVLAVVDANLFLGNEAEQNGGAVDADSAGRFVFTNNVIARNSAIEDAAGIGIKLFVDVTAGSADLINNTVTGNSAGQEGGGMDFKMIGDDTAIGLYNNIVYGNSAALPGRDLNIDNDDERNGIPSTVEMFNNDFDQSLLGLFMAIPATPDASNLNNVDPLFVDTVADDYALQAASPLIDAGTAAAPGLPAVDYDGSPRVAGVAPDIGAFEFTPADTDGDGIDDNLDNCTLVSNPAQVDTNGDGYGNRCDADLNNDGIVNFEDLAILSAAFFTTPASAAWNPDADFNVDGIVNFADLIVASDSFFGPPGPSGLVP